MLNNSKKYSILYDKKQIVAKTGIFYLKKIEKARKSSHIVLLCTGPTRPAARTGKPDPTRARKTKTRPDPSPQSSGSKLSLVGAKNILPTRNERSLRSLARFEKERRLLLRIEDEERASLTQWRKQEGITTHSHTHLDLLLVSKDG